jgi:hypothetical protein
MQRLRFMSPWREPKTNPIWKSVTEVTNRCAKKVLGVAGDAPMKNKAKTADQRYIAIRDGSAAGALFQLIAQWDLNGNGVCRRRRRSEIAPQGFRHTIHRKKSSTDT